MKRIIILIPSIFLLFSISGCIKFDCCTDINKVLDLKYQNDKGDNILSKKSKVLVYYDIKGEAVKVQDLKSETASDKAGYRLSGNDSTVFLSLFVSDYVVNGLSTTYVKVDDFTTDTIKCEHKKSGNSHFLGKIWLNGKLALESNNENWTITIIK